MAKRSRRMTQTILLISESGQFGGMEIRMVEEARLLKSLGCNVMVATPLFDGVERLWRQLSELGVPHIQSPAPAIFTDWRWRHVNWLRGELGSRYWLRGINADLVHVFFSWTDQGLNPLWLAGRNRIPAVLSIHNAFPMTTFPPWHRQNLRVAFRSVQGLYGVSQSALDHFNSIYREWLPAQCIQDTIYNCVDMDRFIPSAVRRERAREHLGLPSTAQVIGSVGRLDSQKKPLSLLDAFAKVKQRIPTATLVLIGEGPMEKEVQSAIHLMHLEGAVKCLPFVPNIEEFFPAFDVHILVSRNEGFGIVTAEAMSCGIPVVGTRVPGTEEIIAGSEAGILVPFDDSEAAATALCSILRTEPASRTAMGLRGREVVSQRFGKEAWKKNLEQFYHQILGRPG